MYCTDYESEHPVGLPHDTWSHRSQEGARERENAVAFGACRDTSWRVLLRYCRRNTRDNHKTTTISTATTTIITTTTITTTTTDSRDTRLTRSEWIGCSPHPTGFTPPVEDVSVATEWRDAAPAGTTMAMLRGLDGYSPMADLSAEYNNSSNGSNTKKK